MNNMKGSTLFSKVFSRIVFTRVEFGPWLHGIPKLDTKTHFRTMAATGNIKEALAILDRLDAEDRSAGH